MKKRTIYILSGLLVFQLFLVACGDSTPTSPSAATTAASTTAATTTTSVPTTAAATTVAVTTAPATTTSATPTVAATIAAMTTSAATTAAPTTQEAAAAPTTSVASAGASQYPMSVTDNTGTVITLSKKPERIVCLTRDCVDDLAELNIEPAAIANYFTIIASNPLIFGEKGKTFATIGGENFFEPNLEDIAKAKPDLIIGIAGVHDKLRESLKNVAPFFNVLPKTYLAALDNLKTIGRMVGKADVAEASANKFMTRLATYKAQSPKNKVVMFGVAADTNSFLVSTDKTLICNLLAEIAKCPWTLPANAGQYAAFGLVSYSAEQVLELNPETIFSLTRPDIKSVQDLTKAGSVWKELKAIKSNQFFAEDGEIWDNNGGIRSISSVLDEAATRLYPDVFPKALP